MSCTGSKKCSCGCDKPYGGYERVPLTFGDGGYISKRITDDLDKLVAEQYGGNSDLKKEALAMMNTMAYGGLTDKGSGSVDATVDPNAGLSTSAYDAGKTKDGIAFYGKKEGTFGEEVKDYARLTGKASLGLVTGAVDAVTGFASSVTGIDAIGTDLSGKVRNLDFGERNKAERERRRYASQGAAALGAAGVAVTGAVLTGGNPKVIAEGVKQVARETGEIDPENKGLQTATGLVATGADIYGKVAGGGPSAEAVGGDAPYGSTKGMDEAGNYTSSFLPGENPDGAGNKLGDIINQFSAEGIPGMAYGGPVSYRPMNNGGYKNDTDPPKTDTDPPKAFTPPNNSQSLDALNVNNVISNSLATPGTSFYPNNPVSFNSDTGRLGDQVAAEAGSMELNREDVGRPPIGKGGKIKAFFDKEGLCRDYTCVEAVKQFYKRAGVEAMPSTVYDNRTFKRNHKEYGFEEITDQKNIKKGDIIQYYKYKKNDKGEEIEYPYHMGVNTSPGKYVGDGSLLSPVHISDMYTDTRGNKKKPFRVYRHVEQSRKNLGKVSMPHGGPHTKVGALQEFLANYDDTLTPRQRGEQMVNTISGTQDDLTKEEQRVAKVRANVIPEAEKLAAANARVMGAKDSEAAQALDYFKDLKDPYKYIDSGSWYIPDEKVKKTAADTKALMREQPEALKDMLPGRGSYNLHAMNPDVYSTRRELYCTPYGCEVYRRAGAKDLPLVSGNMSFEKYADEGKIGSRNFPFERVTDGSGRQVGDIATKSDLSPNDYGNTTYYTTRPHHTTIYAGDTNDKNSINTYQAISGNRGQFKFKKETLPTMAAQEELRRKQEKKGMPVKNFSEPSFNYFRYVGGVPQYEQELESREYLLNHLQEQGAFRNPTPSRLDPKSRLIPTNVPASNLQGPSRVQIPSLEEKEGSGIKGRFNRSSRPKRMDKPIYNLKAAGGPTGDPIPSKVQAGVDSIISNYFGHLNPTQQSQIANAIFLDKNSIGRTTKLIESGNMESFAKSIAENPLITKLLKGEKLGISGAMDLGKEALPIFKDLSNITGESGRKLIQSGFQEVKDLKNEGFKMAEDVNDSRAFEVLGTLNDPPFLAPDELDQFKDYIPRANGGPIEYKAGGSYQGGLRRWFKEEWKDVKTGKPCGRSKGEDRAYPYCRPSNKISSETPATTRHKDAKSRASQKTGPGRVKPIKRKRSKK